MACPELSGQLVGWAFALRDRGAIFQLEKMTWWSLELGECRWR